MQEKTSTKRQKKAINSENKRLKLCLNQRRHRLKHLIDASSVPANFYCIQGAITLSIVIAPTPSKKTGISIVFLSTLMFRTYLSHHLETAR